jgi:hypothetical protein
MRWAGNVACIERRNEYIQFMYENFNGTDHLGDVGVDVRIIL